MSNKTRTFLENLLFTGNAGQLPIDASFLQEGIIDSTRVLELVMFVKDTFHITAKDKETVPENFSVQRLAHYIRPKTGKTVPAASA